MQTSEDTSVYDKVVGAVFNEEMLASRSSHHQHSVGDAQYSDVETELHDCVVDASREVFKRHCAKHLKLKTLRLMDDFAVSGRSVF